MDDLLRKLNTLVNAQLNDLTSKVAAGLDRKPDVNRQVNDLRGRVEDAMRRDDDLRATIESLHREIAALDEQVNAALANGQEPIARALLTRMQQVEKRLAFAEADLRQHQTSTADLIGKVAALEASVQGAPPPVSGDLPAAPRRTSTIPAAGAPTAGSIGALMDEMLGTPGSEDKATSQQPAPPVQTDSKSAGITPRPADKPRPADVPRPADAPRPPDKPRTPDAPRPTDAPHPDQMPRPSGTPPAQGAVPKPWTTATNPAANGAEGEPVEQQKKPTAPSTEAEERPYTAKDLARDARDEAEEKLARTNEGFESVGGLLRDIQARTKSRMDSLDRMLREGGMMDDEIPPSSAKAKRDADKEAELEERLRRLAKPDEPESPDTPPTSA